MRSYWVLTRLARPRPCPKTFQKPIPVFYTKRTKAQFSTVADWSTVAVDQPSTLTASNSTESIVTSAAFLEDLTGEYGYTDEMHKTASAKRANEELLVVVQAENYELAESLREGMNHAGTHIEPNFVFEVVALHYSTLLSSRNRDHDQESSREFQSLMSWASLIPHARDVPGELKETGLVSILNSLVTHRIDMHHLLEFGILAAEKGYGGNLRRLIPHVVRFAPVNLSDAFLVKTIQIEIRIWGGGRYKVWDPNIHRDKLISAPPGSWASALSLHGTNLMGNVRRRIASWLNLVVRTHVLAGRLDHACSLLEELCAALPKCIHRSTYRILLSELRAVHRIGRYNAIAALAAKHLPADEWQSMLESLGDLVSPEASVFSLTSLPSVSLVPSAKPSKTVENHMPSRLHRLRKTIRSRDPPSALELARFMQDYLNLGRTRALSLLYRRVRRLQRNSNIPPSPSPTVLWATAEMVLFRNQGLPVMAIQAYCAYFRLHGVPGRNLAELVLDNLGISSPRSPLLGVAFRGQRLLIPSSHTITVLIDVLLSDFGRHTQPLGLPPNVMKHNMIYQDVIKAYDAYVDISTTSINKRIYDSPEGHHSVPIVPPPVLLPDESVFILLMRVVQRQTLGFSTSIILDMQRLGLEPSLQIWSMYLNRLGRAGRVEIIDNLLNGMETGGSSPLKTPAHRTREGPVRMQDNRKLPKPDLAVYLHVFDGALNGRHMDLARSMIRRMKRRENHLNFDGTREQTWLETLMARFRTLQGQEQSSKPLF
jgi:hypothetical protein